MLAKHIPRSRCAWTIALALLLPNLDATATVVRFEFTVGGQVFGTADFRLFDTAMPNSVANFLGYFDRYDGTFIHRNPRNAFGGPDGNFVVQGGGFEFVPPSSAPPIPTDPPILDEPGGGVQGISNLRGTLSNAKSGPNTVTSQWFVNLDDNSFLDSPTRPDGGFAAFGRVIGNGMQVFDDIDLLNKLDLDGAGSTLFNDVPVGDVNDPLNTLVILNSVTVLDTLDGDYDFDGDVDGVNFLDWQRGFGSTTDLAADNNGDAIVDAADLTPWLTNYGAQTVAALHAVPEPSTLLLLVASTLFLLPRTSRHLL